PGENAKALFTLAGRLAVRGFQEALDNRIFLRGAISYGDVYADGDTLVGPAADDAAEWYDKADWIGVCLTPAANYALESLPVGPESPYLNNAIFTKASVPLSKHKQVADANV